MYTTNAENRPVLRPIVTPKPERASRYDHFATICCRILKNSVGPSTTALPKPPHMPASTMWLSTTPPILNDGIDESRSASLARSLQPNCALRMNLRRHGTWKRMARHDDRAGGVEGRGRGPRTCRRAPAAAIRATIL